MAQGKSPSAKSLSIPCPHCSSRTRIPAGRVTKEGLVYACPNCKTKVRVARTAKGIAVRRASARETGMEIDDDEDENVSQEEKEIIIHGAPMWVVTFADLATLLLTFFVLMLSFANMDIVKFQELMGSVQERFGVTMLEHGQFQAVSSGSLADVDSNVVKQSAESVAREQLVNVIYDAIIRQGFKGSASLTSTDEGVRARIKGRALFKPGQAGLNKSSYKFIKEMANVIKTTKDMIVVVEGHTDNKPIRTRKFPSNWELSTLRASAVLERLVAFGAPAERLSSRGYADTRPLFPNDREETRPLNRRVEFLFKRG